MSRRPASVMARKSHVFRIVMPRAKRGIQSSVSGAVWMPRFRVASAGLDDSEDVMSQKT
jgi:hypothetical protein